MRLRRRSCSTRWKRVNDAQKSHAVRADRSATSAGDLQAARPSRCGAWPSSPTPTTCARRPAARLMERCGRPARTCVPTIPEAMQEAQRIYGERDDLVLCDSARRGAGGRRRAGRRDRVEGVPQPRLRRASKEALTTPVIFDGRNLYDAGRRSRRPGLRITASAAAVRSRLAWTPMRSTDALEQRADRTGNAACVPGTCAVRR